MIRQMRTWALIGLAITCLADSAMAQRRGGGGRGGGRGGGFRGGGGGGFRGGGGGFGGGGMRAAARPSVSRPAGGFGGFGGGGGFNRGNIANRPSTPNIPNRGNIINNNPNRGNIIANNPNRGNINNIGNRNNIVASRPVNVGDVDVNGGGWNDWDDHWDGCCYNPWGAAAAGALVGGAITAAAIGSTVYTLPADCVTTVVNGIAYNHCGDTWYQPQFEGTTASYVVVSPPQ